MVLSFVMHRLPLIVRLIVSQSTLLLRHLSLVMRPFLLQTEARGGGSPDRDKRRSKEKEKDKEKERERDPEVKKAAEALHPPKSRQHRPSQRCVRRPCAAGVALPAHPISQAMLRRN